MIRLNGDEKTVAELATGWVNQVGAIDCSGVAGQRADKTLGQLLPTSERQSAVSVSLPHTAVCAVTLTIFTTDPMVHAGEAQVHATGPWSEWPVAIFPARNRNASQTWKWRSEP